MEQKLSPKQKGRPRTFDREKALESALFVFWNQGYTNTSIADLCNAININPPSLYAAFGNKSQFFIEILDYYRRVYWDVIYAKMDVEKDIHRAVHIFFRDSVNVVTVANTPGGCLSAVATLNLSTEETKIQQHMRQLKSDILKRFENRLRRAVVDKQLPSQTDIPALALALQTYLYGIAIQAQAGTSKDDLLKVVSKAGLLLPKLI